MTAEAGEDGADEVEIPNPFLDAGWEYDVASQKEEEYWQILDTVSAQKKRNTLSLHRTIGCLIPIAIVTAFLMFLAVVAVYVIHLVAPLGYRWLSADELKDIHAMIFSGVAGGAVTLAARAYLLADDDPKRNAGPPAGG